MAGRRTEGVPGLSLTGAVCGFVAMTALVLFAWAATLIYARSDRVLDEALDAAVRLRSEAGAETLARQFFADWRDLETASGLVADMPKAEIQGLLDGIQGDGQRISWAGYADTEGRVLVASDGLLEGADVSQRPWFRNGLRGGFAGDVHEALLLARALPDRAMDDPLRLVDLALPVRSATGEVQGVLGLHIDFGWTERMMAEIGRTLGLDLYLLGSDGEVIVSTRGDRPSSGELEILRGAIAGGAIGGRETWPNGRDYFASLVPSVDYGDLPNFGWRLVGRLEAEAFRPGLVSLRGTAAVGVLGALTILAGMTGLFVMLFIRPITRLGRSATQIADGEDVYPPESRGTREASQIGDALLRLQDRALSAVRR